MFQNIWSFEKFYGFMKSNICTVFMNFRRVFSEFLLGICIWQWFLWLRVQQTSTFIRHIDSSLKSLLSRAEFVLY
jgi:hypothetical protein